MLKITKNIEEANLITHSGKFHADDVFSTAFMSEVFDNPVVLRTNIVPDGLSDDVIEYDGIKYTKAGNGNQYIKIIDFGKIEEVEGKEETLHTQTIASWGYRISQLCSLYLEQGYMTKGQYIQLVEMYNMYSQIGGNGMY